jgi:hypothetical protein
MEDKNMPLPIPRKKETKQHFIARCSRIVYEETDSEGRKKKKHVAICFNRWRSYEKAKKTKESWMQDINSFKIN